jgi:uncharacterized repeat protein (TIGR01451 family)
MSGVRPTRRARATSATATLVMLASLAAGCRSAVDRTTLPVVRHVENRAVAEYQSVWSSVVFRSEPATAEVALVAPRTNSNVVARRGDVDARADAGAVDVRPDRGEVRRQAQAGSADATPRRGAAEIGAGRGDVTGGAARGGVEVDAGRGAARATPARGRAEVDPVRGSATAEAVRGGTDVRAEGGEVSRDAVRGAVEVSALRPILEIEKTADTTHALPGDRVNFTLTVRNTGTAAARRIELIDFMPPELELLSVKGARSARGSSDPAAPHRLSLAQVLHPGATSRLSVLSRVRREKSKR